MKKTYLQPTMMVVMLQQQSIICASPAGNINTNTGMGYGGGGNGPARARRYVGIDWDNEWSE